MRFRRGQISRLLGQLGGAVLWEGPSEIDEAPIAVIATGLQQRGELNRKLGDVVQTWIIRTDVSPNEAIKQGRDESVCGHCKLRGGPEGRACYVNMGMVDRIWDAYLAGKYARIGSELWPELLEGRSVRLGAYGDPAAVPISVWTAFTTFAAGWIGYTHHWRSCDAGLRRIVMASVDTPEERLVANAFGWRTFRTRLGSEPIMVSGEIDCPAALGKTTCEKCLLCNGSRPKTARTDERTDVTIVAHGWKPAVAAYGRIRQRLRVIG